MTGLRIQLLGELRLEREGAALPLPASKKSRGLLGYLVATGAPHSRSHLCDLFWEGPVDPKGELRWSLAKLRPLLDEPGATRLRSDREQVAFASAGARVDIAELGVGAAAQLARGSMAELETAAAGFRGEFLEGLELADCYRFDQWLIAERERWRSRRVAILQALAGHGLERPEEGLRHARAWATLDPLDERAHAAVVRMLGRLGRGREALGQYESAARILRQELGRRPGNVLEEARHGLQSAVAGPPAPAPSTTAAVVSSRPEAPVFRGREPERTRLAAALLGVDRPAGEPCLALVTGEPGIGKTRLLAEFAAGAAATGRPVLYGRAYEAEMVRPYGPWIDALRSVGLPPLADDLRQDLSPLLPELGRPSPDAADRARLFDAVLRVLALLAESAGGAAPIVVLDDLQWADESSIALLHYALRSAEGRALYACAARPAELAANPAATALARGAELADRRTTLPIEPLDYQDVAALVRAVSPGVDARRVMAESEGNPLFSLEIARARVRGEDAVPESLAQLLSQRVAALGDVASRLLPWAAALGRSFDATLLGEASGVTAPDLVSGVEEMERQGVLRAAGLGAGYDFTHDLLRRAAYLRVSEPRRRLIHARIAATMAAGPDADGALAADVAHHAALGGDSRLAAASYVKAGERSLRLAALAEARELAGRGLQHLTRLPRAVALPLHVALLSVLVRAGLGRQGGTELEEELRRLVEETHLADLPALAQTARYLLATLHDERGNPAGAAAQVLRAAEEARRADPATAGRALSNAGRCLAQIDREHARAERLLLEASELVRQAGIEVIDVPWGLGLVRHHAGDVAGAARALEEAVALARRDADHWSAAQCLARLAMIELESGATERALERCRELRATAEKLGEGSEGAVADTLQSLASGQEGLEAALAALRALDTKGALAYALNLAAAQDLEAGRGEQAERRASEALAVAATVARPSEIALARAVLGRAAAARGDVAAAGSQLASLAADLPAGELSARARAQVLRLETATAVALPTPRPTVSSTTAS